MNCGSPTIEGTAPESMVTLAPYPRVRIFSYFARALVVLQYKMTACFFHGHQGNQPKMELRKDPITRSWVVVGHPERGESAVQIPCALGPEHPIEPRSLLEMPPNGPWQFRVIPHFRPLYHIEGEPGRCAEGIYGPMSAIGAHEIIVEARDHLRTFSQLSDEEIVRVLEVYAMHAFRI